MLCLSINFNEETLNENLALAFMSSINLEFEEFELEEWHNENGICGLTFQCGDLLPIDFVSLVDAVRSAFGSIGFSYAAAFIEIFSE